MRRQEAGTAGQALDVAVPRPVEVVLAINRGLARFRDLGLVVAIAGTRVLGGLLHGVTPLDALTFAGAITGVATLAVLAAWAPARQAERVAPVEILTSE